MAAPLPLSDRPSAALAIEWEAFCCSGHWVRGLLLLWPLSERPSAALAIEWEAFCCSGHWVRGLLLLWPLSERPPVVLDHCTGSLCWVSGECCSWLRVVLIAKLGLDIAFGDAIRIRTASLHHHKQNDWIPIEVMALCWLLHHSALDLLENWVSSQPWPCTPLRQSLQVQSVRVESEWWGNKGTSYDHLRTIRQYLSPQICSLCPVVGITPSVNKIGILFQRTIIIKLKLSPNKPVSRRIGFRIKRNRKRIPDQWYFLFNRQRTWSEKWDLEWPTPSACVSIDPKAEDYETKNKCCHRWELG